MNEHLTATKKLNPHYQNIKMNIVKMYGVFKIKLLINKMKLCIMLHYALHEGNI